MKKSLIYGGFIGTSVASSVLFVFRTFGFSYELFVGFLYGYALLGVFIAYFTHRRIEFLRKVGKEAEAGLILVAYDLRDLLFKYFSFDVHRDYKFSVNGMEYRGNLNSLDRSKAEFADVLEVESGKKEEKVEMNRERIDNLERIT